MPEALHMYRRNVVIPFILLTLIFDHAYTVDREKQYFDHYLAEYHATLPSIGSRKLGVRKYTKQINSGFLLSI